MWKIVHASVTGTSHLELTLPCQDYCSVEVVQGADTQDYLVCVVADGAGSALFGGEGAQLACKVALPSIKTTLNDMFLNSLDNTAIERWIEEIQCIIRETANMNGVITREYACTFLGAVIGSNTSIFFQIGDGAIVVSSGIVQGVVFWPDSGMYANMTYFITDEDVLSHLQVAIVNTCIDEIALFTDGIQNLALSLEQRTPHTPFFEPMLQKMRTSTSEECVEFNELLGKFLDSPPVNERTNDDKTLVLATRKSG